MSQDDSTDLLPVVAYYRCSSPQQELSVNDQRREVSDYCARKGYRVVREYVDEGKSASKNPEKRVSFNRMIADSAAGDFQAIVCYDAARFTRFDNIEGSTPKQVLRSNRVILDTVKEGEFDWRKPEGRWKDMAFCESNKAAALNISRDCIRGRVNALKLGLGYWPNGVVPYGYDKEVTDGVRTIFVKRHEQFRKGRNWHTRLVVNEGEAAIVREVFDLLVNRQWSRRQIAMHLTERKVPPPRGQNNWCNGSWDADNVETILKEKAYIGIASIGRGRTAKVAHNRVEPVEQANACPAVVEPHVWHEAQEVIQKRRADRSKPQSGRCGVLSGFLLCGQCGYRMSKREVSGKVKYLCASAGMRPHLGCRNWAVFEHELLPKVTAWLMEAVDSEVFQRMQATPPEGNGQSAEETLLANQFETLTAKVKGATESALLAPPTAREAAWAMVADWQRELESIRQRLELVRAVRSDPEFSEFQTWWESIREQLVRLDLTEHYQAQGFVPGGPVNRSAGGVGNPSAMFTLVERDRLRALLARLGFACKVWWNTLPGRKGRAENLYQVRDVQIEAAVDLTDESFVGASTGRRGAIPRRGRPGRSGR